MKCWENYSTLLHAEHALSSRAGIGDDVQLPMLLSPSESVMEVNIVETMDTTATTAVMAAMDTVEMDHGANHQSNGQETIPSIYTEHFPGASESFGKGKMFMNLFDGDEYAKSRKTNLYYPFDLSQSGN